MSIAELTKSQIELTIIKAKLKGSYSGYKSNIAQLEKDVARLKDQPEFSEIYEKGLIKAQAIVEFIEEHFSNDIK